MTLPTYSGAADVTRSFTVASKTLCRVKGDVRKTLAGRLPCSLLVRDSEVTFFAMGPVYQMPGGPANAP